ncbi:MAG: hypothetical protein H8E27_00375 [Verrucomicrobia subdivision 3 bacterium]|nr:hypothetical protein [Limisphaerales bacterium]
MSGTKTMGLSITGFVGLIVLIYAGENLRGKAAWEKFKKDWEAKGEVFDYKQIVPKPVPAENNFAHTPMLKALFGDDRKLTFKELESGKKRKPLRVERLMKLKGDKPDLVRWATGRTTDLAAWQKYFRDQKDWPSPAKAGQPADDILFALKKHEADFAELTKAAKNRTQCRFDVDYEATFAALLPHLQVLRSAGRGYTLRALAHLAKDDAVTAFADVRMSLFLANSIQDEPFLISHLVRIALLDQVMQPVWEGIAGRKWNAAQLGALEQLLADTDLLDGQRRAMLGERELANLWIDNFRAQKPGERTTWTELFGDEKNVFAALNMTPGGWLYQNQMNLNFAHVKFTQRIVNTKARRIQPEVAVAFEKHIEGLGRNPYNLLPGMLLPAVGQVGIRTGSGQAAVDHARIACLLELHRLEHDSYPAKLEKLKARTPHDPFTGKPYAYARAKDRYRLHGVGWNQKDDGGKLVFRDDNVNRDLKQGDLIWQYTPVKLPKGK